jgi:hypothetical protein
VFFRDQRCLRIAVVSLMAEKSVFDHCKGYRSVLCGADSEAYERIRTDFGGQAILMLDQPLIFGLWSARSLTQQSGLEATEDGYRSPARRRYAEAATRNRLMGQELAPSSGVDDINIANGIFREARGVSEVRSGC